MEMEVLTWSNIQFLTTDYYISTKSWLFCQIVSYSAFESQKNHHESPIVSGWGPFILLSETLG